MTGWQTNSPVYSFSMSCHPLRKESSAAHESARNSWRRVLLAPYSGGSWRTFGPAPNARHDSMANCGFVSIDERVM